ncbi:MAG: histidine--tRNA ligase [Candidatus Omnitrophica bacterium]|nr:histidine--tRNA ligase [Candidatus Omnitrophota bacterium]
MKISCLKGVQDILPDQIPQWNYLHTLAHEIFSCYGYKQIIIPIIEESALFTRSIGQQTDIVEKEMYTFVDRGMRKIALRPEATASVVRAYLEHGLDKTNDSKLFYSGAMFRGEKPQAGRNRQFYQIGIEALGTYNPFLDAEVIKLAVDYLKAIGLKDFKLLINSVGNTKDKHDFGDSLKDFLKDKQADLCDSCKSRYERNVLRILDCKSRNCKKILEQAPIIIDNLSEESTEHFAILKNALEGLNVKYQVIPHLVRGLDYYTNTVFEITHDKLGAQNTILAGGRYNNLIADLGGQPSGAVGFACGVERLLLAAQAEAIEFPIQEKPAVFVIGLGDEAYIKGFKIADQLRQQQIITHFDFQKRSLKAQMRQANKLNCAYVLILGDDELANNNIQLKNMDDGTQQLISLDDLVNYLNKEIIK